MYEKTHYGDSAFEYPWIRIAQTVPPVDFIDFLLSKGIS